MEPASFIIDSTTNSGKRKRQGPIHSPKLSRPSHIPPNSTNPFSRTPSQVLQFALAGLIDTDEDPSSSTPFFPHRPLSLNPALSGIESDGDEERTPRGTSQRERQVQVLLQSIHQFLDAGQIQKASRAYGLMLQLQPNGRPVDIRHYDLWSLGAEILMREGEQPLNANLERAEAETRDSRRRRWGSSANMGKVRAYFETLIQQHPYDYRRPRQVGALDFWLALLGCEIYNAHVEYVAALELFENDSHDEDMDLDGPAEDPEQLEQGREARLQERREEARENTLSAMRGITAKMDGLVNDQPYSKSQHFLKLYATAFLYIGDLVLPIKPSSELAMKQAQEQREKEHETARNALQKIHDAGGELDAVAMAILDPDHERERPVVPIYSSLPIRQG